MKDKQSKKITWKMHKTTISCSNFQQWSAKMQFDISIFIFSIKIYESNCF